MSRAGAFVRPPGWTATGGSQSESDPEQSEEQRAAETNSRSHQERNAPPGSSEENESDSEVERAELKRRKRKRSHKRSSNERAREKRQRKAEKEESKTNIVKAVTSGTLPRLKDEWTHDQMRLKWPTWRDLFIKVLEITAPRHRGWTEAEKHTALMLMGGDHIRDIQMTTRVVTSEQGPDQNGDVPLFSNLIARCNATYKPKDVSTEITIMRAMMQKEGEPIRDFLDKARKQAMLCGYKEGEERDREVMMLMKDNTIDGKEISKQAVGRSLEQLEAVAINLEAIREKEKRAKPKDEVKADEAEIHALWQKWSQTQGTDGDGSRGGFRQHQFRGGRSGQSDCGRCGRRGGHEKGHECGAAKMECHKCGKLGHLARVCRSNASQGQRQGSEKERQRGRQQKRVYQLGASIRDGSNEKFKVKMDEEDDPPSP